MKLFRPLTPLLVAALLGGSAHAAYSTAELYGPALQQAASITLAQGELQQARAEVARLKADPLALRPARITAEARLSAAEANLRLSELQIRSQLAAELANLAAAESAVRQARSRAEIAGLQRGAAQVRFDAGVTTATDLAAARAEASNAQAALAQAEATLAAARATVQRRTGGMLPRQTLGSAPAPQLETLRAALEQHPRLIRARADIQQAELDLLVKSTDLSAAVEVQSARAALEAARATETDIRLELNSALTAAWQDYQAAQAAVAPAQRTAATAAEQAKVQGQRFSAGLISKVALLQVQAEALEAQGQLDSRRAAVESALAALSVAANAKAWN